MRDRDCSATKEDREQKEEDGAEGGGAHTAVRVKVSSKADVRVWNSKRRTKSANAQPVNMPMKIFQQKFPAIFELIEAARLPMPSA